MVVEMGGSGQKWLSFQLMPRQDTCNLIFPFDFSYVDQPPANR
jgi:hypothetical protein